MLSVDGVRERLVLALDTEDLDLAQEWATSVQDYFGVVKVGLELFGAHGPAAVECFIDRGFKVFLDLKFHDIPNTVRRACAVAARLGVTYLTVHSSGGIEMVRAALEGLQGSSGPTGRPPQLLGVTVLTSAAWASEEELMRLVGIIEDSGADGLVCAAPDLGIVTRIAPRLLKVVPGIRRHGDSTGDQIRVAPPAEAVAAGADLLVIGRPVTQAANPRGAALEIFESVQFGLRQ